MQAFGILCLAAAAVGVISISVGAAGMPSGDELKRVLASTPRPSILMNQAEIEALRGSGFAGEGIRAEADKWLKTEISIPGYGGHGHHFFCDCGTQLAIPPDMEPRPQYTCPACGKKFSGERYDAAVRCLKHHNLANAALYLALMYAVEGKREYSDKAAEILRKYARAYPGPHTNHVTGGILYQSLNEAMWAIPLAQAYDLAYLSPSLSKADKRLIEERLLAPVAKGIMRCGVGGNWGSWHLSAVGVIGFALRDAALVEFALTHFQRQMTNDLGDDGLWPESVHCYHFFPLQAFVYLAEAAHRSGIDLYGYEPKPGKGLKAMFSAPLQYMYPSFRLPAINDGWYDAWLPLNLYEAACRRWPEADFGWVLANGYPKEADRRRASGLGYLAGPPLYRLLFGAKPAGEPQAPEFRSTNYPNFGLCTLRNAGVMLTFHYGRFLGHGHRDKLSFTLFGNGELLIPDYGTPGYGSRILGWYQSTQSHNTVAVDGKSQAPSKQNSIDVFHAGDAAQYAEASASDCYEGVKQTRRILLIGDVCLIVDELTADATHDFDWLLHCEGKPKVAGSYASRPLDLKGYPHVKPARTEQAADGYRVDWSAGKTVLALGVWAEQGGAIVGLGDCPAETDARRASFFICRQHGRSARFYAATAITGKSDAASITREGSTLHVRSGDSHTVVFVAGLAGKAPGEIETDGQIAAVRVLDGKPASAALVRGSRLKWQGKTLIERASKVNCAEVVL